ncbi:hypothetical protein YC2023_024228 [Brassica napus]
MINRDSRGHSYFIVRGEILGFMKDEQLRKHLPRMCWFRTPGDGPGPTEGHEPVRRLDEEGHQHPPIWFKALGGHRASHRRSAALEGHAPPSPKRVKPVKHECPICGAEFAVGQALGGHMRDYIYYNK